MKIGLKEIRPNPFRDVARYPMSREKVEALKASIRSTGFWDNMLVRRSEDGKHYELAYGHHRYQALQELAGDNFLDDAYHCDLPVRKLDDGVMIQIMANENAQEYKVSAEIIDETVRVAREYLSAQTKTPLTQLTASDISQFLGGSWNEDKVATSLQRLGLFDRGTLKREQLKGLSHSAARSIQREVARVEKTMSRDGLSRLGENDDDVTEQDQRRIRAQAQKVASHVAHALSEHARGGGTAQQFKDKSIEAQIETLPDDASDEQKRLSTIDAAAHSLSPRDFQRKLEMLLKYREYMSEEATGELKDKLRDLSSWCKQMLTELSESEK